MLRQRILLITPYGKKKREEEGHGISHELKIFDFQVISAATVNFSADNKLGEGGFGPVYKVKVLSIVVLGVQLVIFKVLISSNAMRIHF